MFYIIQGFLFGIAYVAPIGMQNSYVINTAASSTRMRALQVALITVFFDITLAIACFFGIGLVLDKFEFIKLLIIGIGSLAVLYIGFSLLKSKPTGVSDTENSSSLKQIVTSIFVVTWLNPQALIDGSLLLGGFNASLEGVGKLYFISGVMLASLVWFVGLSMIVNTFKSKLSSNILRGINIVCGLMIIVFGLKLVYTFINEIALNYNILL